MFEAGYGYKSLYFSPYFYTENSKYDRHTWYSYVGLYTQWSFTKNWFTSIDYSFDTENNKNNSLVLTLGRSF
jgi:hypothetical protein